ncbi:MAG: alpha-galactosidase [Deltaproteobacteria bacterium]|nr:alpha-galactosidase [Deltaproteobacteria bacterium]
MSLASLARHERAGRLEPVRLGVRYSADVPPHRSGDGVLGAIAFAEAPLAVGTHRLGPFEISVSADLRGSDAAFDIALRSRASEPLYVESIVLGVRWRPPAAESGMRFLRNGWQSWSFSGARELDATGAAPFPSGPWLRGMFHAIGQPAADRAGWHESDLVTAAAAPSGATCLAGLCEAGRAMGLVYLRRESETVRVEVEAQLEVVAAPAERIESERFTFALGDSADALLEQFAAELGARAGARTNAPFQAGWCSWYQFFAAVSEADILRNLESLAKLRASLPIDVVQIDDGYQRATGDWLATNAKFPRGLAPLAADIRSAGFQAGIWTAPFCVVAESDTFRLNGDWLLRRGDAPFLGLLHREWAADSRVYVLDPSLPAVQRHLRSTFAAHAAMGFTYFKPDFLYAAAMQADAADASLPRAARLQRGLAAMREGAGAEAFILGCGCPLGAAVGFVDGMRIGPDTAPHWKPRAGIAGIEDTAASGANALRNTFARVFMHRRLWLNDPDCLMVRSASTELTPAEIHSLAAGIAASGGMAIVSDDVAALSPGDLELLRESLALAREVDAGAAHGTARALGLLDAGGPHGIVSHTQNAVIAVAHNASDAPATLSRDVSRELAARGALPPFALLGGTEPEPRDDALLRAELAPHASLAVRVAKDVRLAVFCDYDGTFAKQDVGSTIVRTHAAERRAQLWARLERGELDAWSYNMELLNGLAYPERTLNEFLRTIEIDPGGRALVDWCEEHGIPFRILSDGFDYNLERLQRIHGVRFAHDSNRLWYEQDRWRIAARYPDPRCGCATGVCKAARIREFRTHHPGARVIHVGNGRVSDLCGARAADLVFAKDSLAEELTKQGVAFEPFETLHDVIASLERLVSG